MKAGSKEVQSTPNKRVANDCHFNFFPGYMFFFRTFPPSSSIFAAIRPARLFYFHRLFNMPLSRRFEDEIVDDSEPEREAAREARRTGKQASSSSTSITRSEEKDDTRKDSPEASASNSIIELSGKRSLC